VVIAVSVLDMVVLHRDGERIPVRAGKTTEVLPMGSCRTQATS
jgi:hypothetical protein